MRKLPKIVTIAASASAPALALALTLTSAIAQDTPTDLLTTFKVSSLGCVAGVADSFLQQRHDVVEESATKNISPGSNPNSGIISVITDLRIADKAIGDIDIGDIAKGEASFSIGIRNGDLSYIYNHYHMRFPDINRRFGEELHEQQNGVNFLDTERPIDGELGEIVASDINISSHSPNPDNVAQIQYNAQNGIEALYGILRMKCSLTIN